MGVNCQLRFVADADLEAKNGKQRQASASVDRTTQSNGCVPYAVSSVSSNEDDCCDINRTKVGSDWQEIVAERTSLCGVYRMHEMKYPAIFRQTFGRTAMSDNCSIMHTSDLVISCAILYEIFLTYDR